jgi:hypothetical protein
MMSGRPAKSAVMAAHALTRHSPDLLYLPLIQGVCDIAAELTPNCPSSVYE